MPPFDYYFYEKTGFGEVMMILDRKYFKGELEKMEDSSKGYFTLGVKSKENINISVFWNNN